MAYPPGQRLSGCAHGRSSYPAQLAFCRQLNRSGFPPAAAPAWPYHNDNISAFDEDSELRRLSSRVKFGHAQAIRKSAVPGNSRIYLRQMLFAEPVEGQMDWTNNVRSSKKPLFHQFICQTHNFRSQLPAPLICDMGV